LPSALERLDAIAPGHDRRLAVFLDYGGTLTPIVPRPEDAVLAPEVRETVAQLARLCTVAIISGRDLAGDVHRFLAALCRRFATTSFLRSARKNDTTAIYRILWLAKPWSSRAVAVRASVG
jgi:hypothetical protein